MTLAATLDAFLEATREDARQVILRPLELRLEAAMMRAFKAQERRFMRTFKALQPLWIEPELPSNKFKQLLDGLREAIEPIDWEPLFTEAELATLRLFLQPLTSVQAEAMLAGGRAAIADIGLSLSFDLAHPEAVRYLEQAAIRVAGINETTREEVRRILIKGTEEGWSYNRVAGELQAKWEAFRTPQPQQHIRSRAHLIAVTEMGDAYVEGNLIAGRDLHRAGLPMVKRWLTEGGERVCPICQGNGGDGWIPIDAAFSSGHGGPTAHPACRCDVEQRAAL